MIPFQVSFSNSLLPSSERVDRAPTTGVKSTPPARDGPVPRANHDRSRCRLALLITSNLHVPDEEPTQAIGAAETAIPSTEGKLGDSAKPGMCRNLGIAYFCVSSKYGTSRKYCTPWWPK